MKKSMVFAGLLALLASPVLAAKAVRPVVGVVVAVNGKPQHKPFDKPNWQNLKMNAFVYEGDVVRTAKGEQAAIALVGGAEFRINEGSEYTMEASPTGLQPAKIFAKFGQAWTRLLHGKSKVSIRSSMAVCSVRGTTYGVDTDDKQMKVNVYEGAVTVSNEQGSQSLSAGQMTNVAAGGAPETPQTMSQGDYSTWQNNLNPLNVDKNLQRLDKEADRVRKLQLKFKKKDGTEGVLDMNMKKK